MPQTKAMSWEFMMQELDRITQHPDVMGGKACIRGLPVTVDKIVGQISSGRTIEEILADYPYLEREDIRQALRHQACGSEGELLLAGLTEGLTAEDLSRTRDFGRCGPESVS